MKLKKTVRTILVVLLVLFVAIQFVPYGRGRGNPPVRKEPAWNSPRTRELVKRACFDCHSNETKWPWYSHVAPVSWLVAWDVEEGRKHLNFSEFDREQKDADEASLQVMNEEMPLWYYLPLHPEARLTPEETVELIDGLDATFGEGD